jgi:hypothetical protein
MLLVKRSMKLKVQHNFMMNNLIVYASDDNLGGALQRNCPTPGNINNITDFINFFTCTIMRAVLPLLVGLAVAGFVYGIVKYFLNPENEEKRKEGKTFMLWGVIALFIIVSIWSLVGILSGSFFSGGTKMPFLPV